MERLERRSGGGDATRAGEAPPAVIDLNVAAAPAAAAEAPGSAEHVRPGYHGAYGLGRVRGCYTPTPVPAVVKPEWPQSPGASGPQTKVDMEGSAIAGVGAATSDSTGRKNPYNPAGLYWSEPAASIPGERAAVTNGGPRHHHPRQQQEQWPSPSPIPAGRGGINAGFLPFSPAGRHSGRDKRLLMDALPRSNKCFADDEYDEEDDFGKSETSSHRGLTVKVDGDGHNSDQKPSTPRSKHSATEQRRRSKINDRFQILRSLIPQSDQKRDKASFLLEVIEYIQFLQEKVQKYESSYPGWNHDNVKLMPWQKNSEAPGESMVDPSNIMKNGPVSGGIIFRVDSTIGSAPSVMLNSQNMAEAENISHGLASKSASMPIPMQYPPGGASSGYFQHQRRLIPDSENMVAQPLSQWLRSCTTDCSVSTDVLGGQDDLVMDEGTISLSSMYSDGLLSTLTLALQSSGIDLSQANVSVQINLGRRAISRPISSAKDDPSASDQVVAHSRVGSSGEESEQAIKRHKSDNS